MAKTDDKGVTVGLLQSVKLTVDKAAGELPSRDGNEPDFVKGARSTLAQITSMLETELAHLARQEG